MAPAISLISVGIAYGLLGWNLSAYQIYWAVGTWFLAINFAVVLFWGERITKRMFRLGPRGVLSMLILSSILTLAAVSFTVFSTMIILLASQMLARLELQAFGLGRRLSLVLIVMLSLITFSGGWVVGKIFLPSSPFWLN
ncbi:MAG: hypothetical protein HC934_03885 [Acaryochloridaceae cyanobacterium SU_2_1]|nr:hypothetical protein [Acaryochloridaceae cyanobacterium SU_2_1]NJM95779.1 hypothetical protein [Acaryochloridaceae cyanobacterium CSU_5_19]